MDILDEEFLYSSQKEMDEVAQELRSFREKGMLITQSFDKSLHLRIQSSADVPC